MFRVLALAAALIPAAVSATEPPAASSLAHKPNVEHGAYLVRTMGCNDCHTPWKLGPKGPEIDMTRALTGHPQDMKMPPAPQLPPRVRGWRMSPRRTPRGRARGA